MSETPGGQTGWKWWGKVLEAGGPGLRSAEAPLPPIPHCSVPPMAVGLVARVPRKRTRAACGEFLWSQRHFLWMKGKVPRG